jgi:hypothetical protein
MYIYIGYVTIFLNIAITVGMSIWGLVEGVLILTNKEYKDANGNLLAD